MHSNASWQTYGGAIKWHREGTLVMQSHDTGRRHWQRRVKNIKNDKARLQSMKTAFLSYGYKTMRVEKRIPELRIQNNARHQRFSQVQGHGQLHFDHVLSAWKPDASTENIRQLYNNRRGVLGVSHRTLVADAFIALHSCQDGAGTLPPECIDLPNNTILGATNVLGM
jgi:hypothetical protein